jgi:hypothetical protein
MAAGRVLAGDSADVGLDLARMGGCQVCVKAGYGSPTAVATKMRKDRLIWILDGYAEVHEGAGAVTHISKGESTLLARGKEYRLVFPHLSLYLQVEARG